MHLWPTKITRNYLSEFTIVKGHKDRISQSLLSSLISSSHEHLAREINPKILLLHPLTYYGPSIVPSAISRTPSYSSFRF